MVTALQQQLAAIAANSTHQLDHKAQKARHGKSLLFEPRDAATQSFDTIYQLCYEGFEELCALDSRFLTFGRNLFSEQSKSEDRTQMTARENDELNKTVESFLGLAGGKLLLKPAMKALEWLVRRFRVQEYTTEAVLLTFLPYHTSPIFPTLLSILPEQLPPSFRFLHPYVTSLQCPPRHAILSAAINNAGLFSALSQYVLHVAKARHHSSVLLAFWASITAQAVSGMIDASRSGRDNIRRQREEDILLRVLPILQSALSIKGVPELYLSSCMIMTILSTKASLNDKVTDAMMEAVAGAWVEQTLEDGLMCLAVLAEEKHNIRQPKSVTNAIIKSENVVSILSRLSKQYRTDRLILASCLGGIDFGADDTVALSFTDSVVDGGLLSHQSMVKLVGTLLQDLKTPDSSNDASGVPKASISVLKHLLDRDETAEIVQTESRRCQFDPSQISAPPSLAVQKTSTTVAIQSPESMLTEDLSEHSPDVDAAHQALPSLDLKHPSFLDPINDKPFEEYLHAFVIAQGSAKGLEDFLNLTALHRKAPTPQPQLLSFLIRVGASGPSPMIRACALENAASELRQQTSARSLNMQSLVPYAMAGLGDPSKRVRQAAAEFCLVLDKKTFNKDSEIWCAESLHGSGAPAPEWLTASDAFKFWSSSILLHLEDCVLDGAYVIRALVDALNASRLRTSPTETEVKHLKGSLRMAACNLLAGYVAATPVLSVKLRLLDILTGVGKTASNARRSILLPFVKQWIKMAPEDVDTMCTTQRVSRQQMDETIIGCLSHRTADELQALQDIASGDIGSHSGLSVIAFGRLRTLWPSLKAPSQAPLASFLLDLSLGEPDNFTSDSIQAEALNTLRGLTLSTEVAVHLMESLPDAADLKEVAPPAKKRRTSKHDAEQSRPVDTAKLHATIRRITIVLELLEAARPERHLELLKGLFHLLGELYHFKTMTGSQLIYLQGLIISCLSSVVDGLKTAGGAKIDQSVIRADLIVECVRTTSSTQVHNSALLLMSSLASWAPELVLHSVMPLFTFMSSTLLKQSDEFSAHVTDQTVSRIIPPLAASLKRTGKDLVTGTSELLLSFTAAFEHIPLHRRAGLFQHLVRTLGAKECLFAVVAMLIERYPEDPRILPFICDLMNAFSVVIQLHTIQKYLELARDSLSPRRGMSDTILGLAEKDADSIEDSIEVLLEKLSHFLRDDILRKRVAKDLGTDGIEKENIQSLYAQILDQTMHLTRDLANNDGLKDAANAVLAALLLVTPTKDFIESSTQLMRSGSDETRQQVFRSLEARVVSAKASDVVVQNTFLEVLSNCCAFVFADQSIHTRHAAITCIDQIVEKFGKRDRAVVAQAASCVAGGAALGSEDRSLRTISILCLATILEVLGDEFIPTLPKVMDATLDYLERTLDALSVNRRLHSAGFTFASAVLDHIPSMMASSYLDRTLSLAARSVSMAGDDEIVLATATQFCMLAAKNVAAQRLFASIDTTWPSVAPNTTESASLYLQTVQLAIQHHPKATISKCAPALFSVMLQAFDLRRGVERDPDATDSVTALYDLVDGVALDMTLKMNDTTFRPFFIRLVEWAVSALPGRDVEGKGLRATSLYSFAFALSEQLKSIVTTYASFLLENAATTLNDWSASRKPRDLQLVSLVLQTLSSSFRHDQDDFWQVPAHFDAIASPLLSLLTKAKTVDVTAHIIPAICELAAAAASPQHHKAMNTQIMSYMRHQEVAVRLAAVKCERAITEKVQFDWLGMLPEMLPFISELQEDDDEAVECETLRWVKQIEDVTGESMGALLQ